MVSSTGSSGFLRPIGLNASEGIVAGSRLPGRITGWSPQCEGIRIADSAAVIPKVIITALPTSSVHCSIQGRQEWAPGRSGNGSRGIECGWRILGSKSICRQELTERPRARYRPGSGYGWLRRRGIGDPLPTDHRGMTIFSRSPCVGPLASAGSLNH